MPAHRAPLMRRSQPASVANRTERRCVWPIERRCVAGRRCVLCICGRVYKMRQSIVRIHQDSVVLGCIVLIALHLRQCAQNATESCKDVVRFGAPRAKRTGYSVRGTCRTGNKVSGTYNTRYATFCTYSTNSTEFVRVVQNSR